MKEQKYYAVMAEGRQTPSKLWDNYEGAENEAKRICQFEKQTTYVLVAVTKIELNDIKITKLD